MDCQSTANSGIGGSYYKYSIKVCENLQHQQETTTRNIQI